MIAAPDQLGAVLQDDPVAGLDRGPVGQHRGDRIPTVDAIPDRAVDLVSGAHLGQRLGAAVRHQDGRLALQAVRARMLAAAVRVDGPPERHPGCFGHAVDDGLGLHLVKGHAAETGCVERAGDRASLDKRERRVAAAGPRWGTMLGVRASRRPILRRQIVKR